MPKTTQQGHGEKPTLRFKCVICGKLTAGRRPNTTWGRGDGSFYFPRRHNNENNATCPGVYEEAEWVGVSAKGTAHV